MLNIRFLWCCIRLIVLIFFLRIESLNNQYKEGKSGCKYRLVDIDSIMSNGESQSN